MGGTAERQCKVSPGTPIVSLIVNILVRRNALYRVEEFYRDLDVPSLFGQGLKASDFNDDALGRAIDRMHAADPRRVFESVACGAVSRGSIQVRSVHADTTSVTLYGEFAGTSSDARFLEQNPDRPLLNIAHGYSKQHRPDLKQFLYGLVVSAEGLPLLGGVHDGNLDDKTWNQRCIEAMKTSYLDPQSVVYVADSALVTADNLALMDGANMRFISRLPENYGLAGTLKAQAWAADRWTWIGRLRAGAAKGASYAAQSFEAELHQRPYRFIVVHSSALDNRKSKAVDRRIEREHTKLEKALKDLAKQVFSCESDARTALAGFLKAHANTLHTLEGAVNVVETPKRPPGRPRKDAVCPVETTYTLSVTITSPTAEATRELKELESAFVLITTLPEAEWSDAAVIKAYKEQGQVERRFGFLRQPVLVDGIYLQSLRRAEALAYVFLLALFVAAFIEMKLRRELAARKEQLEVPGGRLTDRPTIQSVLDLFVGVQVLRVTMDGGVTRLLPKNTDDRVLKILTWLGYDASIYTRC